MVICKRHDNQYPGTMQKFILMVVFLLTNTVLFSQNDIIVIKHDTLKCRIIENGIKTLMFSSLENKHFSESALVIGTTYKTSHVDYVQFFQNPRSQHSTRELMGQLTVSNKELVRVETFEGSVWVEKNSTPKNSIYWFGLDFTRVKIKLGIAPRSQYSEPFFRDCNDFLLSEQGLRSYINHFNFILDTGVITSRNSKINLPDIYNRTSSILPIDSVRAILQDIKTVQDGIGFIIFVTEMNKETESITFYTTFFDLKTKMVLLCLKEMGKAGGVGMAKHWTKPIIEFSEGLIIQNHWKKRYLTKEL
ncbi:hypothetical protein D4R20_00120 [bacterium]|nr:MAG: hypothetical protein D4R20_00120 [bacterium]